MAMISSIFIRRPRFAVVIAMITVLAGLLALTRIPVAQLPDIVPPEVNVWQFIRVPRPRCWRRPWRSRWKQPSSASTR